MNNKYRFLLALPAIILTLTLFVLSSFPQLPHIDLGFEWEDKLFHFIAYFAYGVSLILAVLANLQSYNKKKAFIIIIILGAFYGMSDEIHQYFVPGRDCDIFDWLADISGVFASLLLFSVVRKKVEIIHLKK